MNKTICALCNSLAGFVLNNGSCVCKTGYLFSGTICNEICGDGKQIASECDDGNIKNGDGCSSACLVEMGFKCTGGSITSAS